MFLKWLKETDSAILCNVDILTTGFDEPSVECIIVNRSTTSLALWLQMTGRGGRLYPGKEYFNIIDLGLNAVRHGDWSDPRNWKSIFFDNLKDGEGIAPVKDCPKCGYVNHAADRFCGECGYEFPIKEIKESDDQFKLVLLKKYKTGIDSVDMYQELKMQGYKPHKVVHEIQKELLKSLKYVRKDKFLKNKESIILDLKKAFNSKYNELSSHDKEIFKRSYHNYSYWHKQIEIKLNDKFGIKNID